MNRDVEAVGGAGVGGGGTRHQGSYAGTLLFWHHPEVLVFRQDPEDRKPLVPSPFFIRALSW